MKHELSNGESGAFQKAWDFHSKKTLGNLLKSLRELIEVPEDVYEFLDNCIKKRNTIVHGFLIDNAMHLFDPKGRVEIEQELVELKKEVKRGDVVVNRLLDAFFEKYGTSNAMLKRDADRRWELLNPEGPQNGRDLQNN